MFFRFYGQHFDYENTLLEDETDAEDSWNLIQGGFRMDYIPSASQSFTLQAELYDGEEDDTLTTLVNGQHILGKWTRSFSEKSEFFVQAYYDRSSRYFGTSDFTEELTTIDIEAHQQFMLGERSNVLIGAGFRHQDNETTSSTSTFTPEDIKLNLISGFIQDQIDIVPEKFTLTLGSKFLHNDYTGFEIQPSIRFAWTISDIHTLWSAVSRAVRTPSRLDVDLTAFQQIDHPAFVSEKVVAYELGYKLRPFNKVNFSLATFYNQYTDLRTINVVIAQDTNYYFGNDMGADTWGIELSANVLASNWWRLRGGLTYLSKEFTINSPAVLPGTELLEGIDPDYQVVVQSVMDITEALEFDLVLRYIDDLPAVPLRFLPAVDSYLAMNARIAWEYKFMTLALTGQNLLAPTNREFGNKLIPRSINARITLRW